MKGIYQINLNVINVYRVWLTSDVGKFVEMFGAHRLTTNNFVYFSTDFGVRMWVVD
jgi:hypothetical protein